MAYTLQTAARIAGGEVLGAFDPIEVEDWTFDSRLIFKTTGVCFLAIPGPVRTGARYVSELMSRGVRQFCVARADLDLLPPKSTWPADVQVWVVRDVIVATQRLAALHREKFDGQVVGITGSNGKTIVKEWLYTLLGGERNGVYRSPGSYNSQLGVALSVLGIPAFAKTAIIEVGISKQGEMAPLAKLVKPSLGIFTNLGDAHAGGFSSPEAKLAEKLQLFAQADQLVIERELWTRYAAVFAKAVSTEIATRWSYEPGADYFSYPGNGILLDNRSQTSVEYAVNYADDASFENLTHSLVAALELGAPPALLEQNAERLPLPQMRLSVSEGNYGVRIVDDSYTNDAQGLLAAVNTTGMQARPDDLAKPLLILGPLAQGSGRWPDALDEQLAFAGVGEVWWVGFPTTGAELPKLPSVVQTRQFAEVADVLQELQRKPLQQRVVLVKGARSARFDRIAQALQLRTHGVTLSVRMSALTHNLAAFRERLRPTTRVCVMVKAGAYGTGSAEMARYFERRGVDYLAVAYLDEGIELRRSGSTLPIFVGNTAPHQRELLVQYGLEPEVSTLAQLHSFGQGDELVLHLKIDTGMHRLGFEAEGEQFSQLLAELKRLQPNVASVFSHLSASDRAAADAFSQAQNQQLKSAYERVCEVLPSRPLLHIANSAAAWRLPALQHDMVRLGIGVYGLGLEQIAPQALEPAHQLTAQVVQVRTVEAGEVVGYGLGGRADHRRKIGVVNIGYADGLRRDAGHGRFVLYAGQDALPTVGSICMDFCMVDLSNSPGIGVGSSVEVFGLQQSIQALADCYGTIPYEVLTGIGQRVRRLYIA